MQKEILTLTNSLFEVLSQLKGINCQTENYLASQSRRIEKNFGQMPFSHLTSNFILNDLKAKTLQESKQIFLGNSYGADNKNASEQIKSNINFYFSLSLSYSYEVFEIYIRRLLRIIEHHDSNTIINNIVNSDLRDQSVTKSINNLKSSNNDTYFKIIRRILPEVARIEQKNCRSTNLSEWYQAFSNYRHSVTHGNLICSNDKYIKYKRLTDRYFPVTRHCNSPDCEKWRFQVSYDALTVNLTMLGEYGYLIASEFGNKYGFKIKET